MSTTTGQRYPAYYNGVVPLNCVVRVEGEGAGGCLQAAALSSVLLWSSVRLGPGWWRLLLQPGPGCWEPN